MNNFQMYRHIQTPGWTLRWTWAKKEVRYGPWLGLRPQKKETVESNRTLVHTVIVYYIFSCFLFCFANGTVLDRNWCSLRY
ncbi:hypothetical protein Hdeb2414_s0015g00438321 [Helianthus debilis subsp. tardiflorus]